MLNIRLITLIFTAILSSAAIAQPRSIDKIISKSTIDDDGENKIKDYATAWAKQLLSEDPEIIKQAHEKLVDPFGVGSGMTEIARSLYGKYLEEGFEPILNASGNNNVAAVNALQIISLLGTTQSCSFLDKHAEFKVGEDGAFNDRPTIRLWASIGLGTSFLTGQLPVKRVERYANRIPGFIKKENKWYVISRQFDALVAMKSVPKLNRNQRIELETLSFELQQNSIVGLLESICSTDGFDDRAKALPFVLPAIRLQLIEPNINEQTKRDMYDAMLPPLLTFVEYALESCSENSDNEMCDVYGTAAHSASLLITKALGSGDGVRVIDLWNNNDFGAISELLSSWKKSQ